LDCVAKVETALTASCYHEVFDHTGVGHNGAHVGVVGRRDRVLSRHSVPAGTKLISPMTGVIGPRLIKPVVMKLIKKS